MLEIPKRWTIAPAVPDAHRRRLAHLSPLVVQVLYNRGVREPADVAAFLDGGARFHDPFRMKGIPGAVARIRAAIRARETIVVYGDFDADGVTATALLTQALAALGARVRPYIPHRVDEGYGLHSDALERVAAEGARLVVTVDCGIRSPDEVAHGAGLGLDVIVTDHHAVQQDDAGRDLLPPALAVVNPKQQDDAYPFKGFAGVGLAYKLAQALLLAEAQEPLAARPVALAESDLLDLVALGTVADLAPLLGENRSLVQRGLVELNRARRPGIEAMLADARLAPGRVDAGAISFMLGPRINAAGRLGSAWLSYQLLTASSAAEAAPLAADLGRLNSERQELTHRTVEMALARIEAAPAVRFVHLVADRQYHPGIVGLAAGRLAEALYRPVLVAEAGDEETHGSARSIPEFDITAALDACRDLTVRHGGHAAAAGFTVRNENVAALHEALETIAAQQLEGLDLAPSLAVDAVVELADVDFAVAGQLARLEPCGQDNRQPVFASTGLEVVSAWTVGAEGRHLKLMVRDPRSGTARHAIAFRMGDRCEALPDRIDLAYAIEVNEFNGRSQLQLNVRDIREA